MKKGRFFSFLTISYLIIFFSYIGFSEGKYILPSQFKKNINDSASQSLTQLKKMSEGLSFIAEEAKKGVVYIYVTKSIKNQYQGVDPFEFFFGRKNPNFEEPNEEFKQEGLGSGFIVDLKQGYILTNNHVVDGADEINLKLSNGETYDAKIVGTDADTEIAVLQISDKNFNRDGLKHLVLSNSEKVKVGEFVVALGAPFRLEASVTLGVVSATGRGPLSITKYGNFIQTDAAINPGNSGGPLLDLDGNVVAINTAIASRSGGYNGIGFAIPSNLVREVSQRLINDGSIERGYIGVGFVPFQKEWGESVEFPKGLTGVVVTQIKEDGPADKAGIKKGDVIVAVSEKKLQTSNDLVSIVGLMKPGTKTNITIYRSGKKKELSILISNWPDSESIKKQNTKEEKQELQKVDNKFGLLVKHISKSKDLVEEFGIKGKNGLVVTFVEEDSVAFYAGLRRGDFIILLDWDNKGLDNSINFYNYIKEKEKVVVGIERQGEDNLKIISLKKLKEKSTNK
ncbi:MAG: serine protease [Zetaproteobacteria bacterium]|nr:serine protease [Pseudobdellovibrionaceae bacterium]|tara:strand:- start:1069 stop:2601 length:1533 start_codon:yes stop_codon:yes gene_type:complete